MRTCAPLVLLGLCPKPKYPPLCGGIFILQRMQKFTHMGRENKKPVRYTISLVRYIIGKNRAIVYFYAPEAMTGRKKKSGK